MISRDVPLYEGVARPHLLFHSKGNLLQQGFAPEIIWLLKLWERLGAGPLSCEASRVARLQELAAVDSSDIYGNGMNEMARNSEKPGQCSLKKQR